MKKKLTKYLALLCVAACVFSLTACSEKKSSEVSYTEETAEEITAQLETSGSEYDFDAWLKSYAEGFVTSLETDFIAADKESLLETFADDEVYLAAAKSYLEATEELGEYSNKDAYDMELEMSDNIMSFTGTLAFEKRDLYFTYTGDFTTGEASLVFERELTIGEILQKAGMNTLLGMGSVFLVLILISFVIKCLGLFAVGPKDSEVKEETPVAAPAQTAAPAAPVAAAPTAGIPDEVEMAIVIATAIAAAEEETGSDGYRVRSIKRAKNSKWRRA